MHLGGFHLGSGVTQNERIDNLAWLRHQFSQAALNGSRVAELPAGRIQVELTAGDINSDLNGGIRCIAELTGTLTIRGKGARETIIDIFPKSLQTLNYAGFMIDAVAAAAYVTIEDLTIDGPTTAISTQVSDANAIGFYSSGGLSDTSTVTLNRARVLGKWDCSLNVTAAGKKHVTVRECYLEADEPINMFYDTPTTNGGSKLSVFASHLKATYFGSARGTDSNAYCMYVHPSISLWCGYTTFENSGGTTGYAVHIFGSPDTLPDYVEFDHCHFLNCKRGVLTNKNVTTRFSHCTGVVDSNVILTQGSGLVALDHCNFKQTTGTDATLFGGTTGGELTHCSFDDGGNSTSATLDISGGAWSFDQCRFNRSGGPFALNPSGSSTEVRVTKCQFFGSGALRHGHATGGGAKLYVRDSTYNPSVNPWYRASTVTAGEEVVFENCRFLDTGNLFDLFDHVGAGQLRGKNNYIAATGIGVGGTSSGWHQLYVREGSNPSTVASASTITLSPNFDLHHITGTTTVNTINILASTSPSVFAGKIRLVADGAFATGNSGNIVARTGAARTVGEIIVLEYDPTGAKWRECL